MGETMNIMNALLASLIGGFIAGLFSIIAVRTAHKYDLEKEKQREDALIKTFLLAIYEELETVWERYIGTIGEDVEHISENKPLAYYYPVTEDYFKVYNENCSLIGKIDDNRLRKLIIVTYTQAKGLLDSFRMNNNMLQKYESVEFSYRQTGHPEIKGQVKLQLASLVKYAQGIKKQHCEVKKNVSVLLNIIKEKHS
jgi:hypothetical protein